MNNRIIYYASIEYNYTKESPKYKIFMGGFVYAFVKVVDSRDAIKNITSSLKEMNIKIKSLDFVTPYDPKIQWDKKEYTKRYLKLYKEAEKCDEVIFDIFYDYENG
jgi:hypothetical protein